MLQFAVALVVSFAIGAMAAAVAGRLLGRIGAPPADQPPRLEISLADLRQWVTWVDDVGLHDGEVIDLHDVVAGVWPTGLRYWPDDAPADCGALDSP